MNNSPTQLFSGQATNGQSGVFPSKGGFATLLASGTFGGSTITVQASADGGSTWVNTPAVLTTASVINFISGAGLLYRLSIAGTTGTTNVNAWVAFQS